jgi:hypothetical protein
VVTGVQVGADGVVVTFDRLVTVRGAPRLAFAGGAFGACLGGSGTNALTFAKAGAARPTGLDLGQGLVIGSEAVAVLTAAATVLPTR